MKTLKLDVWGGLGDNLQVSTIPRRFFETYGYKGVYISNSAKWRNEEIKKLVWDKNPYIAGYTEEPGTNIVNAGLVRFDGHTHWIANMEKIYQFKGPYSLRPEIYFDYEKSDSNDVSEKVVVDITCSNENSSMKDASCRQRMKEVFDKIDKKLTVVRLNNIKNTDSYKDYTDEILINKDIEYINIDSIEQYCNVIKFCKKYVCNLSGNHSLAAAIREEFICFIPTNFYNMKYFVYEGGNINYIQV